jgi:PEP-CTERM motif
MKTMKTILSITSVLAALAVVALPARATNYLDATGDFTGGVGALDITSVSVVNDATTLTFTINLAGDPTAQTWYNYYIGISENLFGGVGGNLNGTGGWGHNFQMSTGGMDFFIGSWGTGASLLTWDGTSAWTATGGGTGSQNTTSVTASVPLSALGLSAGNSFTFDVLTADTGSDTGLDALSDSVPRTWGNASFDTGANALTYTVVPVPEPTTLALLSGGVILLVVRRNRTRK